MTRIAVIGSGVSGSLVARILSAKHRVTLFEADSYVGGHANTVNVEVGGTSYPVDTGFMVFNRQTYPNFCRLLKILGVSSRPSDMSFSVHCCRTGLEYQGSSLDGLFAQRKNLVHPSFWKLLLDIIRFNSQGLQAASQANFGEQQTVGDFLREIGVGKRFLEHYFVPMAAAIWSARPSTILEFPAGFMLRFFANHGLLQLRDRPQWRTIVGGAREYLAALLRPLEDRVRLENRVTDVVRQGDEIVLVMADGSCARFDEVVLATHADQSLALLADPTPAEQTILGSFPYQANDAILHTDTRLLPKRMRAWASWNYRIHGNPDAKASVTYHLSRLQGHASADPILLTLNETAAIDSRKILRRFCYRHPSFGVNSIPAQQRHREISGANRTHFCGAYWGAGFHEDGVNSALRVARHFGLDLESCTAASTKASLRIAATCP